MIAAVAISPRVTQLRAEKYLEKKVKREYIVPFLLVPPKQQHHRQQQQHNEQQQHQKHRKLQLEH